MGPRAAGDAVRLEKVKRPGGLYRFDLALVRQDEHGTWLHGPVGSPWLAPHDGGTLPVAVLVLLATGRPWAAWWVDDPADRRLELDVCLPPEQTSQGWRYVDLELDPVRHEPVGSVEVQDRDEYEEAVRHGWMSPADAVLARSTAEEQAALLRDGDQAWVRQGWVLLAELTTG